MSEASPTGTADLLDAVTRFLDELVDGLDGATAYQARVAAHALRIVGRELALGEQARGDAEEALAGVPGAPADRTALVELLRAGELDGDDPALWRFLVIDVLARAAIDCPAYPTLAEARDRWQDQHAG